MNKQSLRFKLHQLVEFVDYDNDGSKDFDFYDLFMVVVITISLIPLIFKHESEFLILIERITVIIFIIDYCLRWITADYHFNDFSIKSFIKYPVSFWAVIDLLAIIPSLTTLNESFKVLKVFRLLRSLRMLRAFKIFKVAKMARYSKSVAIIGKVFKESREALGAVVVMAITYILISALIIFNVEPESFGSFFDALYWATVSLTTVGYGDIYPITVIGRSVAMLSSLFGIAIVALPAGIITAGYMKELNKEEEE